MAAREVAMASSSGGSIILRLAVAGSDEVKAALASLGPAGANALRQIEQAQAGPSAGMKALDAAGKDVTAGMQGLAGNAGIAGSALTAIGPAGLAAAAGIGAAIAAAAALVQATKGAMEFGEALETAAKTAGVSTTSLQTYRYALEQAGGSTEQADQALRSFTTAYGLAGEGQKRYLEFFEKLGFTPEQLKSFSSVDEALDATVDKIAGLGNAADRAAFAKRLGLQDLLPLLEQGKDKIADLKTEAAALGAVMDEKTVASLANAEKQFKSATDVINVQFKSALVDLTPALVSLIGFVAELARQLNYFMSQFEAVKDQATDALVKRRGEIEDNRAQLLATHGVGFFMAGPTANHGGMQGNSIYAQYHSDNDELAQIDAELSKRDNAPPPPTTPPAGDFKAAGPRRHGPTPDEIAKNSAALDDQGAGDIAKATKDELQAQLALTSDVQQRADIQAQIAAMDAAAAAAASQRRLDEAKLQLQQGKITQAAYDKFVADEATAKSSEQIAEAAKAELANRTAMVSTLEQQGTLEKQAAQNKVDALKAQLELTADTQKRRDLSLEIYDAEYEIKKNDLLIQMATAIMAGNATDVAKIQSQLNGLAAGYAAGKQGVSNANPGNTWDATLGSMKTSLQGVNTEFKNIAGDGLQAFNQSLFDANGKLQTMGQIATAVFGKMLSDLEQYLLKQAEIGLFGGGTAGGSGGGGGILSTIFGGLFGGGGLTAGAGSPGLGLGTGDFGGAFGGFFASGGTVPGSGSSDSVLAWLTPNEKVMTRAANQQWGPVLDLMNEGKAPAIPHFASGGQVGGGSAGGGFKMGGDTYHVTIDRSINAPGADSAALQRVADRQEAMARGEPERVVGYIHQLKKGGFLH